MKRTEVLAQADKMINGPRAEDYGDAYTNHERIAKMWSVLLDKEITVAQVYQCMIAVKLSRLIETPKHTDSWIDVCGYGALAGEGENNGKK